MIKSKLLQIIKKLNIKEQNSFQQYVLSPFFNKHKKVMALCTAILSQSPDFEGVKLEKKYLQKKINVTNNQQFNHIISYLLELVLNFLGYEEYQQNVLDQKRSVLTAVRKKNLNKPLNLLLKQYNSLQERYPYEDINMYWQKYQYYKEMDYLFLQKDTRDYNENLQLESDYLDLYYILNKLKISCDMASRNVVISANYQSYFSQEISANLLAYPHKYKDCPAILAYHTILKMLTEEDGTSYYEELKKLLKQHIVSISLQDGSEMFIYAHNYCIKRINNGNAAYYQEFLELYKMQLVSKTLLKDGYLEEWDFKNIVTVGVRLKDFEWTEQFIHQNKDKLRPAIRENAYLYSLSVYYYATSQYKKALQLLYTVEFTDITYYLGAKNIQLKSYYELGELDAFYALLGTFRTYVKRSKKLSKYRKEVYFNFLKLIKKIENLRGQKGFISKVEFEKNKEKLVLYAKTNSLANSDWISLVLQNL